MKEKMIKKYNHLNDEFKKLLEVFCTRLGVLMRREIKIRLNLKARGIISMREVGKA